MLVEVDSEVKNKNCDFSVEDRKIHPYFCVKKAAQRILREDEELSETKVLGAYKSLMDYLGSYPIMNVLANAGISNKDEFYSYVFEGNLEDVLVEYFVLTDASFDVQNDLENRLPDVIQKYFLEDGSGEYTGNDKDTIYNFMESAVKRVIGIDKVGNSETNGSVSFAIEFLKKLFEDNGIEMAKNFFAEKFGMPFIKQDTQTWKNDIKHKIMDNCADNRLNYNELMLGVYRQDGSINADRLVLESNNAAIKNIGDYIDYWIQVACKVYFEGPGIYKYPNLKIKDNKVTVEVLDKDLTRTRVIAGNSNQWNSELNIEQFVLGDMFSDEIAKVADIAQTMVDNRYFTFYPKQEIHVKHKTHGEDNALNDDDTIKTSKIPLSFSMWFTEDILDNDGHDTDAQYDMMQAFNSPFFPFVLLASDIAKEGINMDAYCRKIVHFDLPDQPAVLIQRNGRIDRFHSLVLRQRMAVSKQKNSPDEETELDWNKVWNDFNAQDNYDGIIPNWYIPGEDLPKIEEYYFVGVPDGVINQKNLFDNSVMYRQLIGTCLPDEKLDDLRIKYPDENLTELNLKLLQ